MVLKTTSSQKHSLVSSPTGGESADKAHGTGSKGDVKKATLGVGESFSRADDVGLGAGKREDLFGRFDVLAPGRHVQIPAPSVVLKPADIFARVQNGVVEVSVPMRAGQKLDSTKVRPDTVAHLSVVIKDGKIDRNHSDIRFRHASGKSTNLDGPAWLNAKRVYIDGDGQIRVQVPTWKDPNITTKATEAILGSAYEHMPDDPKLFIDRLTEGARLQWLSTDNPALTDDNSLFDLSKLTFKLKGDIQAGPLHFGDDTRMILRQGSKVDVSGNMQNCHIDIQAQVGRLDMEAQGTQLGTGAGELRLSVDLKPASDSQNGRSVKIAVSHLDVEKLHVRSEELEGGHRMSLNRLKLGEGGEGLQIESFDGPSNKRELVVNLDHFSAHGFSAEVLVQGVDQRLSTMRLGGGGGAPMDLEGSLKIDTRRQAVALHTHIRGLRASTEALDLVDAPNFELELAKATIGGSGFLVFEQEGVSQIFDLRADEGEPWTLHTQLEDLKFGMDSPNTNARVDLASTSEGTLKLEHIKFGEGVPQFKAAGSFDIAIDALELPLGADQKLSFRSGTKGTLNIPTMAWEAGAASPELKAQLTIELGADVDVQVGDIPGLEGARVQLDVETGNTQVVLDIHLDASGTFRADCAVALKRVGVRTRIETPGLRAPPKVTLPALALSPTLEPLEMSQLRQARSLPDGFWDAPLAPLSAPPITRIELVPASFLSGIQSASLSLAIPLDAGESMGKGWRAATIPENSYLKLDLALKDGKVVADKTQATFVNSENQALALDGPLWVNPEGVYLSEEGRLWLDLPGWADADITETILGEGVTKVPLDTATLLAALSAKMPVLGEALVLGGPDTVKASEKTPALSEKVKSDAGAKGKSAQASKLHFAGMRLDIEDAFLNNTEISLGGDQKITFREGSRISVVGNAQDFSIEGEVILGSTRIGEPPATQISLDHGNATVKLKVWTDESGLQRTELMLSDLEAEDLNASALVGQLDATFEQTHVRGGGLLISHTAGEVSRFELDLPYMTTHMSARGELSEAGYGGVAERLEARAEGSLRITGTSVEGHFDSLDFMADDLRLHSPDGGGIVIEHIDIKGATKLYADESGELSLKQLGVEPLVVNANIVLPDGESFSVESGRAEEISLSREGGALRIGNLEARVSALIFGKSRGPGSRTAFDLRSAYLEGSMELSRKGLQALSSSGGGGQELSLRVRDLDASIADLGRVETSSGHLVVDQMDLEGEGRINLTPDGHWTIEGNTFFKDGQVHTSLRGRAVSSDFKLVTQSPKFELNLGKGSHLRGEIETLSFLGDGQSAQTLLRHIEVDGVVEKGQVTIGASSAPVQHMAVLPGARVSGSFDSLRLNQEKMTADPQDVGVSFRGMLRVEGRMEGGLLSTTDLAIASQDTVELEQLDSSGRFRLILGMHRDQGKFSAASHSEVSGKIKGKSQTQLDTGALRRALLRSSSKVISH
jgi:hypothetical protein